MVVSTEMCGRFQSVSATAGRMSLSTKNLKHTSSSEGTLPPCMRSARSWIRGGLIGCSLSPQRFAVVRDGGSVQVANLRDEVVEGGHLHEVTDFLM